MEAQTKEEIKDVLKEVLQDPEAAQSLAEKIAVRIKNLQDADDNAKEDETNWIRGEHFVSCIPCMKISDSDKVPAALRKFKKGNFGKINVNAEAFHIRRSQKEHEANDLHKWCAVKGKALEEEAMKEDLKNFRAAENTVRNVLFCLQNGGGSELFVGLMNKDNLTEGIEAPTKNDSKKTLT